MSTVNCLVACRTVTLAAVAISLNACLYIPIPYPPDVDEVFIPEDKINEIEIGKTSHRDLQRMLGVPDWAFGSATRLIYKTRTLSSWQLGGCRVADLGYGPLGCDDRWYDTEILDITLDRYGIVKQWEVLIPDLGERTASGIVLYRYDLMKVYGTEDAELTVKALDVIPGRCSVFLYSWKPARPETSIRFQVDGNEDPYWFLTDSDFFHVDLAEGLHTIGASVNWVEGVRPESIELTCESGNIYFMRVLIDGLEGASFEMVPAEEGRRAIDDRELLLSRDSGTTAY